MLVSTAYFPNIQYLTKFRHEPPPRIEACENFQKQTFRNRTQVMTADGVRSLIVPVIHSSNMAIRQIEIDYTLPWQRTHLRTIEAAYRSAPYFEHYFERIEGLFATRHRWLFDLNCETTGLLLEIFGLDSELVFTTDYDPHPTEQDFRNSISPKPRQAIVDPDFESRPYYQVFSERLPFAPNLSALDLLFCEGCAL